MQLDSDLVKKELAFAANLGGGNPKNYQIWYHRRALLESSLLRTGEVKKDESISIVKEELSYIAQVFEI